MAIFDDLMKLASQFVERQRGLWHHSAWLDFLLDVRKINIELTEEMQKNLWLVLESMRKFYESSMDIGEMVMKNTSEQTAIFVRETKGIWDCAGWEKFVEDIQDRGVRLTEETVSYLGLILGATKSFYGSLPLAAIEEKKEPRVEKERKKLAKRPVTKAPPKRKVARKGKS